MQRSICSKWPPEQTHILLSFFSVAIIIIPNRPQPELPEDLLFSRWSQNIWRKWTKGRIIRGFVYLMIPWPISLCVKKNWVKPMLLGNQDLFIRIFVLLMDKFKNGLIKNHGTILFQFERKITRQTICTSQQMLKEEKWKTEKSCLLCWDQQ